MTRPEEPAAPRLVESCWPVFEFATNFIRQVKHNSTPPGDQARYEALSAIRDAEDLTRNDPVAERAWNDRVKAMMAYFIDYLMLNTEWPGRDYWYDCQFETDPEVLNHPQALGGERFFQDCDEVQREYEIAERRERRDRLELAELMNLYFICLRLGFRGQYHDRPQELADYTRRLFTRLPAYATTRSKDMFPEAYEHNEEIKVNYKLGTSLTIVLTTFAIIVVLGMSVFHMAWRSAVGSIKTNAEMWETGQYPTVVEDATTAQSTE